MGGGHDTSGEPLVFPEARTTAEYLAAMASCSEPYRAIDAALSWCSADVDANLRDVLDPAIYRYVVNTVDRAGNRMREMVGIAERPLMFPDGVL